MRRFVLICLRCLFWLVALRCLPCVALRLPCVALRYFALLCVALLCNACLPARIQTPRFVVADSICGNKEFSAALRKEFSELIPGAKWDRIPKDHPLMSREFRGFDLSQVSLRRPERSSEGVATFRETRTPPVLEGLWVEDRLAVVISPYDISCALENGSSIECEGYSAEDARRIGINILLYALQM